MFGLKKRARGFFPCPFFIEENERKKMYFGGKRGIINKNDQEEIFLQTRA
jgi:hypothetical protein